MMNTNVRFEDWVSQKMQDPAFRAADEALEPFYQVARLRIQSALTQAELAAKVGTKQPNIARLERGQVTPNLDFLRRVAAGLDARLQVRIVPLRVESQAGV